MEDCSLVIFGGGKECSTLFVCTTLEPLSGGTEEDELFSRNTHSRSHSRFVCTRVYIYYFSCVYAVAFI